MIMKGFNQTGTVWLKPFSLMYFFIQLKLDAIHQILIFAPLRLCEIKKNKLNKFTQIYNKITIHLNLLNLQDLRETKKLCAFAPSWQKL